MLQHFPQHLCCRNPPVQRNGGKFGINSKHFQQFAILTLAQAGFSMLQYCCSKPAA
jgi:hypothetical protein